MSTANEPSPHQSSSRRAELIYRPESYATHGDRWAIVIGVSQYQHGQLNLQYADRDAEEFYTLLLSPVGGGFSPDHIVKLTNQNATTANVTKALRSFLKKPGREDLVIIYCACHGSPDIDRPGNVYLLTHDTDPNDIAGTALPMREIDLSLRENLLSERVVIFADTCHSAAIGGGIGRRGAEPHTALVNRYLQEMSTARGGIALLTSAEANEVSFEDARWGGGHGVFTHYLLEGMQGAADLNQNGLVTVGELFEYVRAKVQDATDHRQHPAIGTNPYDRNLPLAITFPYAQIPNQSLGSANILPSSRDHQLSIRSPETNPQIEPGTARSKSKKITILASTIVLTTLVAIAVVNQPSKPPKPPLPPPSPSVTQPLATVAKNERAGFQAILDGDLTTARSYFGYAYEKYPEYHRVDEIYHQLLSVEKVNAYNSASQSQKQIILKQVFRKIVDEYYWGAPDDILSQMKIRLQ